MSKKLTCKTCGKDRPEDDFQKNRWGRTKVCRKCRKPRAKKVKTPSPKATDGKPPKLDPNSAGYDDMVREDVEVGGEVFDEKTFRIDLKGVGTIHTLKISARQWIARQCTYYPGMKPEPKYTPEQLKKMSPFDESYDSFWAEGYGRTEQAAIRAVREDIKTSRRGG
jgi:hypothetical protein